MNELKLRNLFPFRWALTKWGDKFSPAEVDDIFGEFEIDDDGFLDGKAMCSLFVAGGAITQTQSKIDQNERKIDRKRHGMKARGRKKARNTKKGK